MKKILLSLGAAVALAGAASAQTSYGLKAGVNLNKISNYGDNQSNATSFHVTGFADIPVAPSFSIQPGVSLQGKGTKYDATVAGITGEATLNTMSIEIPVNAVYYIPAGTGDVFLGAGPYVGFNVSGKVKGSIEGNEFINQDLSFSGDNKDMNVVDAGVNFLGGYKFGNGLLLNAGYGLGLTNLNPHDAGSSFSNRVLSFGVGFQF